MRVSASSTRKLVLPDDVTCHCITCSDEGCPMRVVAIDAERGLALCEDADGARRSVETALVEPVAVGDTLLVHAGTALIVVLDAVA
jgi:hydrogenase assembly chaperone HypC/HupF